MRVATSADREGARPELSVVVPARNAAATLDAQLSALVPQAVAQQAEVIVVDKRRAARTVARRIESTRVPCRERRSMVIPTN